MKSDAETTGSKFNRICGLFPQIKGRNVDWNERGIEIGRVEIRRPRCRGEATHVLRGNKVASIQRVARSVEPQTIADVAQKTRDVADVALLLPEAVGSAGPSLAAHSADHFVRGAELCLLPDALLRARAVVHHELPVPHAVARHLHAAIRANMGEIIPHQTFLPARLGQAFYAKWNGTTPTAQSAVADSAPDTIAGAGATHDDAVVAVIVGIRFVVGSGMEIAIILAV